MAERKANSDMSKLSLPGWVSENSTQEELNSLAESTRRKCVRVFSVIQHQVFALSPSSAGPFVWAASAMSFIVGNKRLITFLNRLGYCVDYDLLLHIRRSIFVEESSRPAHEKIIRSLMTKLVWDNVDAELTANHLRLLGKLAGIHGTIMQS